MPTAALAVESLQSVRRHFPTPLAQLFQRAAETAGDRPRRLAWLLGETLRFVALLALQDSLAHGVYGAGGREPVEALALLRRKMVLGNWRRLLRAACLPGDAGAAGRAVPELSGWEADRATAALLDDLLQGRNEWAHGPPPADWFDPREVEEFAGQLQALYARLAFLKRYVLVAITEGSSSDSAYFTALTLRGAAPEPVELEVHPDSPAAAAGELYLLGPHRRRALALKPALWWCGFTSGAEVGGLHWLDVQGGEARKLWVEGIATGQQMLVVDEQWLRRVRGTGDEGERPPVQRRLQVGRLLGGWLGPRLAEQAFQARADGPRARELLLTDESWERLAALAAPPDEVECVGGRYRVERPCQRAGEHVDVFAALEEGRAHLGRVAIHVLKRDAAGQPDLRAWFARRLECWRRVDHPAVLAPHAGSDPASDQPGPFLVTDFVPGGRSLQDVLRAEGSLPDDRLRVVLRTAAEVVRAAHRAGVRLLALPPRHFLLDEHGGLRLTGFEAAVPAGEEPPPGYWQRISRDWSALAPELAHGWPPRESADVFALGVLLGQCRLRAGTAQESLDGPARGDRWACLAYHGLAADPDLRFRTAAQFLAFLDDWPGQGKAPATVAVPPGEVLVPTDDAPVRVALPGFRIGKYPVTNFEYERFCDAADRPQPYRADSVREAGPWCPVTGVSLPDAEAYCAWLGRTAGGRWRLPREAEWLRAATLGDDRPYAWGADEPGAARANHERLCGGPSVVGAFPRGASAAGCLDLAGNVWEWCSDFLGPGRPLRVLKGGAYDFTADDLRVGARRGALLTRRSPHVGFRVLCEDS